MRLGKLTGQFTLMIALTGAAMTASSVYASGSFSRPSGGLQDSYNYGKSVFYKKVACKGCPLQGERVDRQSAEELVDRFDADDSFVSGLNKRERMAVVHYLEKRYKLN